VTPNGDESARDEDVFVELARSAAGSAVDVPAIALLELQAGALKDFCMT